MSILKELRARLVSGNSVPVTSIRLTPADLDALVRELQCPPDARSSTVPDGYRLVPVEPTEAMLDAGHAAAWRRIPSCFDMTDAEIVYRAMLAATRKGE